MTGSPTMRSFRVFIQMKMWPPVPCALRSDPSEVEPPEVGAASIRQPPFRLLAWQMWLLHPQRLLPGNGVRRAQKGWCRH